MDIFVSAGEASSDIHCARLIRELKKSITDLKTFGLGGDHLAAEGCTLFMHAREFSVAGGLLEVISRWPKRRRLENLLSDRLFAKKPDLAILVDNGEINLRLASLLHFFSVPVVYFIPPKVWVWRFSRIEQIAQHVNLVLGILPFEEAIYKEWEIPFQYVGNPLVDEISANIDTSILNLPKDTPVVTVLPGSRHTEIASHVKLFSDAIQIFLSNIPKDEKKPEILIPVAPNLDFNQVAEQFKKHLPAARVVKGSSHACLKAARVALVKSGTSTLEAALIGTPMVLAYHASKTAEWTYKHIVNYKGFVGMVNLFLAGSVEKALGWSGGSPETPVVPELILDRCTPENIANELLRLYRDGPVRAEMLAKLSKTKDLCLPLHANSPIEAAAAAVLNLLHSVKQNV